MHPTLCFAATATLLTAASIGQVTIPPPGPIYNGFSRGFQFTAAAPFFIARLSLPMDAHQGGDTAGFMLRVNGVIAWRSVGLATSSVATDILVDQGDVVDVIGNWSPAVTGNFTAHNSYSSFASAPFTTTIEGVPHVLTPSGWQWDIGDPAFGSGSPIHSSTGSLGRVLMWTLPVAGHGMAYAYGTGCPPARSLAVYEQFAAGTFDLGGMGLLFVPDSAGSYTILPGPNRWYAGSTHQLAMLGNDTAQLSLPFAFRHASGTTTLVSPSSNGFLWLGYDIDPQCCSGTSARFLDQPMARIAACWMNLDPTLGGGVYADFDAVANEYVITWAQVREYNSANAVDMQIALQPSGIFELRYRGPHTNATQTALTGYSSGLASDPGNSDLSTVLTRPIVTAAYAQTLTLAADLRPVLGSTIHLLTAGIAPNSGFGISAFGLQGFATGVDLAPFGAPGCALYANPRIDQLFVVAAQTASLPLAVPNLPGLAGLHVFNQSVMLAPGTNALGLTFSNGLDLLLDVL